MCKAETTQLSIIVTDGPSCQRAAERPTSLSRSLVSVSWLPVDGAWWPWAVALWACWKQHQMLHQDSQLCASSGCHCWLLPLLAVFLVVAAATSWAVPSLLEAWKRVLLL